jgi:hypothetical protein
MRVSYNAIGCHQDLGDLFDVRSITRRAKQIKPLSIFF